MNKPNIIGYRVELFNPNSKYWIPFRISFSQPIESVEFSTAEKASQYIEVLRECGHFIAQKFPHAENIRISPFTAAEKAELGERLKHFEAHDLKLISDEIRELTK